VVTPKSWAQVLRGLTWLQPGSAVARVFKHITPQRTPRFFPRYRPRQGAMLGVQLNTLFQALQASLVGYFVNT